jgi:excisionase family DNA binding protein
MTVRQVAAYLNVNEKTVYRLAQRRDLPAFKVAGAWRFKREDIDLWIERQKGAGEPGSPPRSSAPDKARKGHG